MELASPVPEAGEIRLLLKKRALEYSWVLPAPADLSLRTPKPSGERGPDGQRPLTAGRGAQISDREGPPSSRLSQAQPLSRDPLQIQVKPLGHNRR